MQDIVSIKETKKSVKISELPLEEQNRLIGAFLWLIEEDKKQNPELYKPKITKKI